MKPAKIGVVDLDTSHPAAWIPILREMGHEVVGVWDGGSVWPEGYAAEFAGEHGIPTVFESPHQMAEEVDLAIIHTCNWDLHIERARPFIHAGRAVLLDKPMVGNFRDANTLLDWEREGHLISGGSSLRWTEEIAEFLAQPVEERGEIHTVFAGCGVDEFNYGIHAYALLSAIMGTGLRMVRYTGASTQRHLRLEWRSGAMGFLSIGPQAGYLPFYATIVTDKQVRHIQIDAKRIYRALLTSVLPYLTGEASEAPMPVDQLIEPELAAIAARASWMRHGANIFLTELRMDDPGYDGYAFAAQYRRSKMGK